MTYATRSDIEDLWGREFTTDLLPDDVDADHAIGRALAQAGGEIDTHLSARYQTPIAGAPQALVTPCVNIAVYNLAIRHTALTTTIEERYRQAVKLLERIADGRAGLGPSEPRVTGDPEAASGGASFSANPRRFTRDRLP